VLAAIITYWALAGGILLVLLAVMTAVSALLNIFTGRPIPADYELTKHFVAVAIFTFLPYCQLTGSNVTVDIFTEGMSARAKAAMVAFSSLFAIAFSLLLLRQMWLGFLSYLQYPEMTPVLHLPLWTAFPPILFSLLLLLIASLITARDGWIAMRNAGPGPGAPAAVR
jgi:TRAP-type C4-dicarboxylate transport system permease small subunit